jgi:CelD/BcsL family acetyltransferase involved in cellulose biosynthesis
MAGAGRAAVEPVARRPAPELTLRRLADDACDWSRMDAFPDRQVFQTREWLAFIADAHGGEPVVAAVCDGGRTVGYFTGLVTRRFGVRILGSPFPGWGTDYMGFNLEPGVSRRAAAEALLPFAWRSLGCHHLELRDRLLTRADVSGTPFVVTAKAGYECDLRRDEEELFRSLKGSVRTNIRQAKRLGVTVEEASDLAFADDYQAQLRDVYAKQSLVPPFGADRVRALIRHLHPAGLLLLLRARAPDGRCIATFISPAANRTMYFWGAASWRSDQHMRPNELLWWHAACHWRERGISVFDLGGGGEYKRKYGPVELAVPFLRTSRSGAVAGLRSAAERGFALRREVGRQLRRR